ncbi:MAG: hypothetical protein ABI954_01100 [Pyrinomonadaceae bacterium]
MEQQLFSSSGDLNIVASKDSSPEDFDFFVGKWRVHNRKLKTRLNNCQEWLEFEALGECHKILNGLGNTDSFKTEFDPAPFEGMTLRLFNPQTKLWSIYWADSNSVVLDVGQIGSFENKTGKFYAKDVFDGKEIIVLFKWDANDADAPVWSQAFSPDNGKTWEWNWEMTFQRQS